MDDQQQASAPSPIYQQSQERNAKWLWILIAVIIVAALVFAFFKGIGPFAQFKLKDTNTSVQTPSPQAASSPSPESSSGAQLNKSDAKIRVLNGSGKAGAASSFKDFLEKKGWKVVSLGNAQSYDFSQTVLKFKESFTNFKDILTNDLSDNYSVEEASDSLEATDSADIEIIIGSK